MSEMLVLRLPEAGRPALWVNVDALGNHIGEIHRGNLTEAAAFAKDRKVRVCVPSADVSLLHANVPTHSAAKVLQAIPFALEDRLAEDVETLHFALGERSMRGYLVAAVTRARMRQWLGELTAVGIAPDELLPDVLAVPTHEHKLTLVLDGTDILARFPDGSGISADGALLPVLIRQHLESLPATDRCTTALIYSADENNPPALEALAADLSLTVERSPLRADTIGLITAARLPAQTINLLQGEFSRNGGAHAHWQRWRMAAALLAGLVGVLIAQQVVSGIRLQHESVQQNAEVAALFHQALPDVTRMVDPKAQMQQRLNALAGGGNSPTGLLSILAASGKTLQSHSGVQLRGLSYHNGVLQLQVQTADIGTLDKLKSALQQTAALHTNLDSVSSNAGQTTGRLTISGSGT